MPSRGSSKGLDKLESTAPLQPNFTTSIRKPIDRAPQWAGKANWDEVRVSNAGSQQPLAQVSITRMSQQKPYVELERGAVGLTPCSRCDIQDRTMTSSVGGKRNVPRTPSSLYALSIPRLPASSMICLRTCSATLSRNTTAHLAPG